jgi:hypothetical protein
MRVIAVETRSFEIDEERNLNVGLELLHNVAISIWSEWNGV